jgi:hypothetical protein
LKRFEEKGKEGKNNRREEKSKRRERREKKKKREKIRRYEKIWEEGIRGDNFSGRLLAFIFSKKKKINLIIIKK